MRASSSHRNLVIGRRPSDDQAKIIHLRGVDRFTFFGFHAEGDDRVLTGLGAFDLQDVENDSGKLGGPAGKGVRSCDGRAELRPFRQMTADAGSFGLRTREMVFARLEIDVVMTGGAGCSAGRLLPVLALRSAVAGFAVSKILGDPIAHDDLGVAQVRVVGDLLIRADHEVRFAAFNAWEKLAAVDLVDEDFEFEILTAFGVGELRGMAESAVTDGSPCAAVIFQWIVAIVAGSGLDHGALSFNLAATGNEFKQWVGDVLSFFPGQLSADDMGGVSVVIGGQCGFESVGENTGTETR